jgi:hypothetical protein
MKFRDFMLTNGRMPCMECETVENCIAGGCHRTEVEIECAARMEMLTAAELVERDAMMECVDG